MPGTKAPEEEDGWEENKERKNTMRKKLVFYAVKLIRGFGLRPP
jgi:hypothetical protein